MIVLLYEYLDDQGPGDQENGGERGGVGNRGITFNVPLAKF